MENLREIVLRLSLDPVSNTIMPPPFSHMVRCSPRTSTITLHSKGFSRVIVSLPHVPHCYSVFSSAREADDLEIFTRGNTERLYNHLVSP
jgi:hypothetical protein